MLRKRQRDEQIPMYTQRPLPPQPPIPQSFPLQDPQLFELRSIILSLRQCPEAEIDKQLDAFLSGRKPEPKTSELIFHFLGSRAYVSKTIIPKIHLSYANFQYLFCNSDTQWCANLLISYLSRNSISDPAYCTLIRQILIKENSDRQTKVMTEQFISLLAYLLKYDSNRKELLAATLGHLPDYLTSKQLMISQMFRQLMRIPEFRPQLKEFMTKLVKDDLELEHDFERYTITHLLDITQKLQGFDKDELFEYLCFKMKSLNRDIRKSAIEAVKLFPVTEKMVAPMIQKDVLGRRVNHRRGILLQMLEDQYKDIRMCALQCLKNYVLYMNAGEVKQIILYMINDESDQVRAEALRALTVVAKNYVVIREDLEIILMPLKESSRLLRYLCYKVIEILSIHNEVMFVRFIHKLLEAYRNYKEDKVFLYRVMQKLGRKYSSFVINNIKGLLDIQHLQGIQEPSWKNFTHKARIILVANAFAPDYNKGIQDNRLKLPFYFQNHYQYIKDVQQYAFDQQKTPGEILPMIVKANRAQVQVYIRTVQAHMVFWKQLPINQSTTKQRFLRNIFQISQGVYNLERVLEASQYGGVYFGQKVVSILQVCADTLGRFQDWVVDGFDLVSLVVFQYYVLNKLNPIYYNKSELSLLTMLNACLINSYKSQFPSNNLITQLQQCNKSIMTTLSDLPRHMRQMRAILLSRPLFPELYKEMSGLSQLIVSQPTFTMDYEVVSSQSKQYSIQCEVSNSRQNISSFRLKVQTASRSQLLQILQSDCKESSIGEDNKRIYSLTVYSHQFEGPIQKVKSIRLSRFFRFTDQDEEHRLCKVFNVDMPCIQLGVKDL